MTDKEFFVWLRSGLRRLSRRWPPIYQALASAKYPAPPGNGRKKWLYKCNMCGELFPSKEVSVDHIIPAGSLLSYDDLPKFVGTLFCDTSNLQVLCKDCHNLKSLQDKKGMSYDEAKKEQLVVDFKKQKAAQQREILLTMNVDVSSINTLTTAAKRVEFYRHIIKGENNGNN